MSDEGQQPGRGGVLRALAGGLRDTFRDMVEEGRQGASEAQDRWWRRYDDLTKYRKGKQR